MLKTVGKWHKPVGECHGIVHRTVAKWLKLQYQQQYRTVIAPTLKALVSGFSWIYAEPLWVFYTYTNLKFMPYIITPKSHVDWRGNKHAFIQRLYAWVGISRDRTVKLQACFFKPEYMCKWCISLQYNIKRTIKLLKEKLVVNESIAPLLEVTECCL